MRMLSHIIKQQMLKFDQDAVEINILLPVWGSTAVLLLMYIHLDHFLSRWERLCDCFKNIEIAV